MLKSTSIISERNKNLVTASDFWTRWKFSQLLQTDVRAFMEEQAEWIIVFSPPSSLPPSNSPLKCVHYISSACLSTHLSGDKVPRGTWNWANTKKSYFSIQHIHLVVATPHSRAGNAHMNTSATINFSNSFLRCNMSLPSWLSACKHTCRWKKGWFMSFVCPLSGKKHQIEFTQVGFCVSDPSRQHVIMCDN